jgi:hypothetical protein
VIHPALVDSAPPEVGGRRSPLGSAGPAVVPGSATGPVRPAETTVVIWSTRSAELGSAGATVVIGSTGSTELRSARSAVVIWSTRSTGAAGAAESTGATAITPITLLLLLRGLLLRGWPTAGTATTSAAGPTPTGPLAGVALRSARRGAAGLRIGESGTGGEGGEADADQDGGRTCRAFEVHGIFPFEVSMERDEPRQPNAMHATCAPAISYV